MKLIKYFLVAIIFTISVSSFALTARAQSANTNSLNFTPEISIPGAPNKPSGFTAGQSVKVGNYIESTTNGTTTGIMSSDLLSKYIAALYNYALAIVAILATIVLMGAGLIWLTSGGDSGKINQAKEMITGSITGMVILFCAWIILNTVNPALLELKPINTTLINKTLMGCCQYTDKAEMAASTDCAKNKGTFMMSETDQISNTSYYSVSLDGKKCSLPGCCITDQGQGLSNSKCINMMDYECILSSKTQFVASNCKSAGGQYNCTVFDQCETAAYGAPCFAGPISYSTCYNKICWTGTGNLNEPCGTDTGAICRDVKSITTAFACDRSLSIVNGRSCGSGLACCKP